MSKVIWEVIDSTYFMKHRCRTRDEARKHLKHCRKGSFITKRVKLGEKDRVEGKYNWVVETEYSKVWKGYSVARTRKEAREIQKRIKEGGDENSRIYKYTQPEKIR